MDYEIWLKNRLIETAKDLGLDNLEFEVCKEQDYSKKKIVPNKVYVAVKHLTATRVYSSLVQPLQVMVVSEENSLRAAQLVFQKFAAMYNLFQFKEDNSSYKMQISDPAVLNNFNVIGAGLRSVLFVSISLIILKNICDVDELIINGEQIKFIAFTLDYGLSTDTQPFPSSHFVKSVKSVQTLVSTLTIPCLSDTALVKKIQQILNNEISGNENFVVKVKFNNQNNYFTFNMKIINVDFITATNDVPSISIGFSV